MKRLPTIAIILLGVDTASAAWVAVAPVRQVGGSQTYSDVLSRAPAGGIYGAIQGEGPVHDAHETTHRINSRLRNQAGGSGFNAAYLAGGYACVLREPRCSLSQVASLVPGPFRADSFGLYLSQMQAHWNDHPLYVLDEWSSYLNGTKVALELRGRVTSETRTPAACLEFIAYGTALLQAVDRFDPNYADRSGLEDFLGRALILSRQLAEAVKDIPGIGSGEQVALRRSIDAAFIREE